MALIVGHCPMFKQLHIFVVRFLECRNFLVSRNRVWKDSIIFQNFSSQNINAMNFLVEGFVRSILVI